MAERGEQRSRESHQGGGALQVAGHDADCGVDLQDGFAEQVIVQEEALQ